MADTGAPWNIPYIEPTDLVRNYPVANELMADAIAAGLSAAGNPGIGSNVVSVLKTDVFSASVAASDVVVVTGLTVSFTPTSATSKVLVIGHVTTSSSSASTSRSTNVIVLRDGTPVGVGAADGDRTQVTTGSVFLAFSGLSNSSFSFIDSPATLSEVVYTVEVHNSNPDASTTLHVNRTNDTNDQAARGRASSSITAIEVAA